MAMTMRPKVREMPTWETAPEVRLSMTIAPVPAKTRAKVPMASAISCLMGGSRLIGFPVAPDWRGEFSRRRGFYRARGGSGGEPRIHFGRFWRVWGDRRSRHGRFWFFLGRRGRLRGRHRKP